MEHYYGNEAGGIVVGIKINITLNLELVQQKAWLKGYNNR